MIEKLNERITIEKSTVVTDKVGNHRNTWEDYFTCFAYASTYQAQEEEGEVTAEQKSVVFTVRWCSETRGLTSTGFRIRFREQLYNIESVDPMNYQKKILKIHCRLERKVGTVVDGRKPLIDRPKALGDIRGMTYIYGMFYRFGLIDVPNEVKKMRKTKHKK